jgi:hypothetical protein
MSQKQMANNAAVISTQDGFGRPVRDSSWSNVWSSRYGHEQITLPFGERTANLPFGERTANLPFGVTGPTGSNGSPFELKTTNFGQYISSNGTGWVVGSTKIAIGTNAGGPTQDQVSIAVGVNAGQVGKILGSVAIGTNSGRTNQQLIAVAIGTNSGFSNQQLGAVAIGTNAGRFDQQESAIAIGYGSGVDTQGAGSIAIGFKSGVSSQARNSIIIGSESKNSQTAQNSVIIGNSSNAESNSISIGYNIQTGGQTGCIVLSTSSSGVTCLTSNEFVLAGVKTVDPSPLGDMPFIDRLPFSGGDGNNIWLPIQIGSKMYCMPIYPQVL